MKFGYILYKETVMTKRKPQDAVVANVKRLRTAVKSLETRVRRLEKKAVKSGR